MSNKPCLFVPLEVPGRPLIAEERSGPTHRNVAPGGKAASEIVLHGITGAVKPCGAATLPFIG